MSQGIIGSSCRYQGWSCEGINRFNELFDLIEADRKASHAKPFEEAFKAFCVNGGVHGKPMKSKTPFFEVVEVRHNLWHDFEEVHESEYINAFNYGPVPSKCGSGGHEKDRISVNLEDSEEDEDPFGMYNQKLFV